MAINRAPFNLLIDDSGNNADGTPWNKNQIKTVLLDPIDVAIGGAWVANPFNAASFWPGVTSAHLVINQYAIVNLTMFWMVQMAGAPQPSPAAQYLMMALPAGKTFGGQGLVAPLAYLSDSGGGGAMRGLAVMGNAGLLAVQKENGATFLGPSLNCYFNVAFPIT
jgi:hypothetical protein